MSLSKADLVDQIYTTHDVTRPEARDIVETFLKLSKNCLIKGDDLLLSGFGKFQVKEKKARRGRNPQTGEDMMLEARRVITFKPSGKLRDRVKVNE